MPNLTVNPDNIKPVTHSWVAVVAYNGGLFQGWQKQKHQPHVTSIQSALEKAISSVANEPVTIMCAGRTDAGVHGSGQVIHFETQAHRPQYGWWMGINASLPKGITLEWIAPAEPEFHARFSAKARRYFYVIDNLPVRPALQADQLAWWRHPLNADRMHQAAQSLLGEHDFSAFRAQDCQAKSPVKILHHLRVRRCGDFVIADIKANAFLYHMVRNLMGVLIPIGQGEAELDWSKQVLESRDRKHAGVTAPPQGLYFARAYYSDAFAVSQQVFYPRFLKAIPGVVDE
jgi:tRNA pseudouridine38-40 synthase